MDRNVEAHDFVARALALEEMNRPSDAVDLVRRGLAEHPEDPDLLVRLGSLLCGVGATDGAVAVLESALALDPQNSAAYAELGYTLAVLTRYSDAVPVLRTMIALDLESVYGHMMLAYVLVHSRTGASVPAEARASIEKAVTLSPQNADTFSAAADLLATAGDPSGATIMVNRGLVLDPEHADLLVRRSASFETGQAASLSILRDVLARDPLYVPARRSLAEILWKTLSRMCSGVWLALFVVLVLSVWIGPEFLRRLAPFVFAPVVAVWIRTAVVLRSRLPRGYIRRRLRRRPEAVLALLLAASCGVLALLSEVILVLSWTSDGVRFGYAFAIAVAVVTGAAHWVLQISRLRRTSADSIIVGHDRVGESHPGERVASLGTCAVIWTATTVVLGAVFALTHSLARQPSAGWAVVAFGFVVSVVYAGECASAAIIFDRDNYVVPRLLLFYVPVLALLGAGTWFSLSQLREASFVSHGTLVPTLQIGG